MPRWPKRNPRPGIDEYGRTNLWYESSKGNLEGVKKELKDGADPNLGDDVNYTPLHVSVQNGHTEIIQYLLDSGANPNLVDSHENCPLWTAVLSSPMDTQIEIISILLEFGANPNHRNKHGGTPKEVALDIAHGLEEPFNEI